MFGEKKHMSGRAASPVGPAFGGFLDVAQGYTLPKAQERQLRFQALFSEQILIPDVFLHCFGPIYYRAKGYVERGVSPTAPEVERDILMASLRDGVIVPVLRTDAETLESNFLSDRVDKDVFLTPPVREAIPVLRFLDRLVNGRHSYGQWTREQSLRSLHALSRRYVGPPAHSVRQRIAKAASLSLNRDGHWAPVLEKFVRSIADQSSKGYFQRGPLERVIATALNVKDSHVYERAARLRGPRLSDTEKLVRQLYRDMVFYYQVGQGTAMADIAAVTNTLDGFVPDLKALREAVGTEPMASTGLYTHWEVVNLQYLDRLSAADLISLRKNELVEYRERIAQGWHRHSAKDIREWLVDESSAYRRAIASKIKSPLIESLGILLPSAVELGSHLSGLAEHLHISGAAEVALFVTAAYIVDKAAAKVAPFHEDEITKRLGRAFNNFLDSQRDL